MKKLKIVLAVLVASVVFASTAMADSRTDKHVKNSILGIIGVAALWDAGTDWYHDSNMRSAKQEEEAALVNQHGYRGAQRDQHLYNRETAGMGRVIDARYDGRADAAKRIEKEMGRAQAGQIKKWSKQGKVAMVDPSAQYYKQAVLVDTPQGTACYSSQLNRLTTNPAYCDGI